MYVRIKHTLELMKYQLVWVALASQFYPLGTISSNTILLFEVFEQVLSLVYKLPVHSQLPNNICTDIKEWNVKSIEK